MNLITGPANHVMALLLPFGWMGIRTSSLLQQWTFPSSIILKLSSLLSGICLCLAENGMFLFYNQSSSQISILITFHLCQIFIQLLNQEGFF